MEEHIILRKKSVTPAFPPGTLSVPGTGERVTSGLALDVEKLDRSSIPDLTRQRNVLAVAPAVPMKLTAPIETKSGIDIQSKGIAWPGWHVHTKKILPLVGQRVFLGCIDPGSGSIQ